MSIFVGADEAAVDAGVGCCEDFRLVDAPWVWLGRAKSAVEGTEEEESVEELLLVPVGLEVGLARRGTNAMAASAFEDNVPQHAAAARMRVAGRRILQLSLLFG